MKSTYRMDLAYDGAGFRGYAAQPGQRTVQGLLEGALETVLGGKVGTSVAGRTDAGVHALGQVVSFEASGVDRQALLRSLNGILGPEISVKRIIRVEDDFDARHSAKWRSYRYSMATTPAPDPLTRGFTWHVGRELDRPAMEAATGALVGEHDFASFCRAPEGKSTVRRVQELSLITDPTLVQVWIRANAFCHQMVRSIVGHLYDVGRGFVPAERTEAVVAAKDRSAVATVAPAHGLTLMEVGYD